MRCEFSLINDCNGISTNCAISLTLSDISFVLRIIDLPGGNFSNISLYEFDQYESGVSIYLWKLLINSSLSLSDPLGRSNGNPLSIIVIAGINGSGKTTLLEYLANYDTSPKFKGEDYIDIYLNGENLTIFRDSNKKKTKGIKELKNKIMYLPAKFEGKEDL